MTDFDEIPEIDLSPLFNNTVDGYEVVAQRLREVYTTVGFGYIVSHNVPQDLIDAVFDASKQFHALPFEEKTKIKQNKFFRGYMSTNESILKLSTLAVATKPNLSEAFIMAYDVPESDPDYRAGINLAGPNQWPENLPGFYEVLTTYNKKMYELAQTLVQVFALAFGLEKNALNKYFNRATTFMRLQYYLEQPDFAAEDQYGIAPHTDYGFLTILAQDDLGGLQVRNRRGDWVAAPPKRGSFMLNSSDMLKRMTNGKFISTPHRVINTSGKKRYSVPFFYEPDMRAVIEVLPQFMGDEAKFPPLLYSNHILGRLSANYNLGIESPHTKPEMHAV